MEPHHEAWLRKNPQRTASWLKDRLADGFDIHHIDGDHDNNSPDNLVLIEHSDHMALHGLSISQGKLRVVLKTRTPSSRDLEIQKFCYEAAARIAHSGGDGVWPRTARTVSDQFGDEFSTSSVTRWAMYWANRSGQRWPLIDPSKNYYKKRA